MNGNCVRARVCARVWGLEDDYEIHLRKHRETGNECDDLGEQLRVTVVAPMLGRTPPLATIEKIVTVGPGFGAVANSIRQYLRVGG